MTTYPQRRKRRRNGNHSSARTVPSRPGTNPTPGSTDLLDCEVGEGEALSISRDHGQRRIPIILWRGAETDCTVGETCNDCLSPRAARLLVGLTTRLGRTIDDFDNGPILAGVAGVRHALITSAAQLRRSPADLHLIGDLIANGRGQVLLCYLGDQLTNPPRTINVAALMPPSATVHDVVVSAKPEPGTGEEPDLRDEAVAAPIDRAAGGGGSQSTQQQKSSYHPRPSGRLGRPEPAPRKVCIDPVFVGDSEANQLRTRRTVARLEASIWATRPRRGNRVPGSGIAAGERDLFVSALGAGFRANRARRAGAPATKGAAGGGPR